MDRRKVAGALGLLLAFSMVRGLDDPPDSERNPVTGNTESVDIAIAAGARVRHTTDLGQAGHVVALVSSAGAMSPRLAIEPTGDSWIVWANPTSHEILCAIRGVAAGAWSAETRISIEGEVSAHPEIQHHGGAAWIVWEVDDGSDTWISVAGVSDDPEPIPVRTVLATTQFAGDVDAQVRSEGGHLWVTWVESPSLVAWSELKNGSASWDAPRFESYAGTDVATARGAIRAIVLGQ